MLRLTSKTFVSNLRQAQRRCLHSSNSLLKAEFFNMPAMSPTMNEGGIVEWKFKEGDSFASGDILLEVETDKSTIDVEAQDDGILAKIIKENGTKDLAVGTPIAILAETKDDLSNLPEVPTEGKSAPKEEPKKQESPAPKKESTPSKPPSSSSSSSSFESTKADPKQTLFPSVASLLESNNISKDEAFEKIQATGPNGRLVKGDVLAYLGKITKDSVSKVASFIQSNSKLDLSNIEKLQIQPKQSAEKDITKDSKKQSKPKPEPKIIQQTFDLSQLQLQASEFSEANGIQFDLTKYIEEASTRAQQFAYQKQVIESDYYDSVFEDLIALPTNLDRFNVKLDLNLGSAQPTSSFGNVSDLLDFVESKSSFNNSTISNPTVSIKVTTNPKISDSEAKANAFIKKFQTYINNPGF
ncbi:Pyruvate dehydrogenase complex protein X component, mitochondrial [Wickerhamomyces ciferrii]|uniref:Dihydrolipoamide dehydrogenase-binding protein of pyruvate dehydrogenase complex n=1 Tax=Wickerhamomyces ciferrii (strain ATCC 14091 / BCRC 22168 / CBS 111 / JCM 3599 / NBRC 0793 / NRRL Y-1031 F-60-10) TaxID=1206466 RepID=K0KUH2_WICCF|nr:Pyruvate dehydrogenase complex protein X component, mitochondrial [Wickerhamomyces ciferrii]CCH46811.1 Pyruvate dehydrogenase complex protein X component, mitochondrial [Wickerhamomyces ciferrii]